jgi:O-antigen ligase
MATETFLNSTSALTPENITDYRLLHWKCALQSIRNNIFFGVGTGDSRQVMNDCYNSINKSELLGYNAHNQFLEMWMKLGLPGVTITFLCLTLPYMKGVIYKNPLFSLTFTIFLFVSMVESLFEVQKGMVLFSFISSIYLGHLALPNQTFIKNLSPK